MGFGISRRLSLSLSSLLSAFAFFFDRDPSQRTTSPLTKFGPIDDYSIQFMTGTGPGWVSVRSRVRCYYIILLIITLYFPRGNVYSADLFSSDKAMCHCDIATLAIWKCRWKSDGYQRLGWSGQLNNSSPSDLHNLFLSLNATPIE